MIRRLVLAAVLTIVTWSVSQAAPLFDNLSNSSGAYDLVSSSTGAGPLGESFTTPSGGLNFSDVTLSLGAGMSSSALVTVKLYNDNGGPGPDLGSLKTDIASVVDSTFSVTGNYEFVLSFPVSLAGNTRYWVVVTSSDEDAAAGWYYANDDTGTGVSAEYSAANYLDGGVISNTGYQPYLMCVSDSGGRCPVEVVATVTSSSENPAVPEPGSLIIIGTAVFGLGLARRRR